jgi:hypothetical protein
MFCLRKIVPYSCHSPVDRFATVSRNCLGTPQVFSPFMLLPTPSQRRLPAAHLHYSLPCFFCSLFGRYFSLIPPVRVIYCILHCLASLARIYSYSCMAVHPGRRMCPLLKKRFWGGFPPHPPYTLSISPARECLSCRASPGCWVRQLDQMNSII